MQVKRHVALKVTVKDLLDGHYVKGDGDWSPNYIDTGTHKISRLNIMGVVVSKNDESNEFLVDDGTGRIRVRSFDNKKRDHETGEIVMIIGRPRIFGDEKYVVPEIWKKIDDSAWFELRKMQLLDTKGPAKPKDVPASQKKETDIFQIIKGMDLGDGVDIQRIVDEVDGGERIIKELLEAGDIFEIKPGRIKILE